MWIGIEKDSGKKRVFICGYQTSDNHHGRRGPWRQSSWRDSSWRDSLRGQTSPRREILRGEIFSVERTAEEREALWRDSLRGETSPRRDNLQGENISMERFFGERGAPGEPG
jgi:hypothetical protein